MADSSGRGSEPPCQSPAGTVGRAEGSPHPGTSYYSLHSLEIQRTRVSAIGWCCRFTTETEEVMFSFQILQCVGLFNRFFEFFIIIAVN